MFSSWALVVQSTTVAPMSVRGSAPIPMVTWAGAACAPGGPGRRAAPRARTTRTPTVRAIASPPLLSQRNGLGVQVPGKAGDDLRLPGFHDHRVVVAEPSDTVQVDAGLAAPHLVFLEPPVVEGHVVGILVAREADAVSGPVDDPVPEPALLQDPLGGRVHLRDHPARHEGGGGGRLGLHGRLEGPGDLRAGRTDEERALVLADVAVDPGDDDVDHHVAGFHHLAVPAADPVGAR